MFTLNLESASVRKYEGGVVGEKEITVANVEDLANKVAGGKLLLELYNKRTGESVKKFASRGQGLNRLWRAISEPQTVEAPKPYVDKRQSLKASKAAIKAAKVVGTINPKVEKAAGPRSGKLAGKKLIKKKDSNPRRADTFGWRSWEAYKSGATYEEAIKAGARRVDIDWDIKHGYVEVAA